MKMLFILILLLVAACFAGSGVYAGQGFNYQTYLDINPDLPRTWDKAECIYHYIHYGFKEKRALGFHIDEYLNANPDLPSNWTLKDGLNHYNLYGKNENRLLAFDAQEYLSLYADLPQDWSYNKAFSHFLNYGKREGRIASFDEMAYTEMYPDLFLFWGQEDAFYHYLHYGKAENRAYDPYDEGVFLSGDEIQAGLTLQSLAGTYRLIGFRIVYSNGTTVTQNSAVVSSYSGMMTLKSSGSMTQDIKLNGQGGLSAGSVSLIDETSMRVSSGYCSYDSTISYVDGVLTMNMPIWSCGINYAETDIWQRVTTASTETTDQKELLYFDGDESVGGAIGILIDQ